MLSPTKLSEGMRILSRSLFAKKHGTYKYSGTAEEICAKVVSDCWNKRRNYLQASNGHFCQFWTRDFGICTKALMSLGYEDKVYATLKYSLSVFSRQKKITTSLTPGGRAFDFPYPAIDSLPLLIHSIREADAKDLLDNNHGLFANEIKKYFEDYFDRNICLARKDVYFSSMKDYAKRHSSTYDNCMLAMLRNDLEKLGFYNPFYEYDIKGTIKENLWNGRYFYDDLSKEEAVTGDSNVFPFWTGVFTSSNILKSSFEAIKKARLDRPFPLKYSSGDGKARFIFLERLARGYEGSSVWPHLGLCFLDVIRDFRKTEFKKYLGQYTKIIEENRNFLEVFDEHGKPFTRALYYSDEGMLWASKYLHLLKK